MAGISLMTAKLQFKNVWQLTSSLNGGFAASLDLTNLSPDEMKRVIETTVQELPFLRLSIGFAVCTTCGQRSKGGVEMCEFCKSPHKVPLYS